MSDPTNPSESAGIMPELSGKSGSSAVPENNEIFCPVCGASAMPEKCTWVAAGGSPAVCRSDVCRGRLILNCSEF
jgi:hypothetical protein